MGLFDIFKRSTSHPELLERLLAATARQDSATLDELCKAHGAAIRQSFPGWARLPKPLRGDRAATKRYAEGLIAVAHWFERAGDRTLLALLTGERGDPRIVKWKADLLESQALLDAGQVAAAVTLLEQVLTRNSDLSGVTGFDFCMPRTLGMLGAAYSRSGRLAEAADCMRRAQALCERAGDREGCEIYERNLRALAGPADSS